MAILTGKRLLFFRLNFIYLINVLIKAKPIYIYHFCENASTYNPNSKYTTNLDATLSSLPNTNSGYGFFNFSVGEGPDTANAISLCRGDVESGICRTCLNDSIVQLRQVCPNQREAIVYYDICFLRYSNATLLGNYDMNKDVFYWLNPRNASYKEQFIWDLRQLMNKLSREAAAGGSLLKFAFDNTSGSDIDKIYGIVQCIPNLSQQQCNDCLDSTINRIPSCCVSRVGARIFTASYSVRYETFQITSDTAVIPPPPSLPSPSPSPVLQSSPLVPPPSSSGPYLI